MRRFIWDKGNNTKNWDKHQVSQEECEDVFNNDPFILEASFKSEKRFFAYGETASHIKLFIVFCLRNNDIRIISARKMSRKEREQYERLKENS
jgi:uncharacterized DUF497 family protein